MSEIKTNSNKKSNKIPIQKKISPRSSTPIRVSKSEPLFKNLINIQERSERPAGTQEIKKKIKEETKKEIKEEFEKEDTEEIKKKAKEKIKEEFEKEIKEEIEEEIKEETKEEAKKGIKEEFEKEIKNDVKNKKSENILKTIEDDIPESLRFAFDNLDDNSENHCARIYQLMNIFFKKKKNTFEYALLVVKVMEEIEKIKEIKNTDKFKIAVRCITELLLERKNQIPSDAQMELLKTIPGSIDAFIQLTKYGRVKNNIKGKKLIRDVYIIKRATDRIIKFVREKKFNSESIITNFFLIISHGLIVVNAYSLERKEKKELLLDVIREFIKKYKKKDGTSLDSVYIKMILDLAPTIIERFFQATDGLFNINKIKSKCFPCY